MCVCDTNAGPGGPSLRLRRTKEDEKEKAMKAKKTKMISLRMTEEQYDKMMELMQIDGYHSRSRFIINTVLNRGGKRMVFKGTDGELMQLRKWLITIYREMHRAGTNLNQVAKAINAIKYRFKLGFEGEEEYRQAVYMTGYAAEKLSWRSKDVHEVAMKILCEYLPDDEEE